MVGRAVFFYIGVRYNEAVTASDWGPMTGELNYLDLACIPVLGYSDGSALLRLAVSSWLPLV